MSRRARGALLAGAGMLAGWGLFEAQWLQTRRRRVPVAGLPAELVGLTILHLSDFHAGSPSLNLRTVRKAVAFGVSVQPEMVVITGDIVAHPRGEAPVVEQLARLQPPLGMYASLGNHDIGLTRDPFSHGCIVENWGPARVRLLRDDVAALERNGRAIEVAGIDPVSWVAGRSQPHALYQDPASLRILLAHFPDAVERLPPGAVQLVLSGHLHGGQICLPSPAGKLRLSHSDWRHLEGVHQVGDTTLVVSRGTGTTLVPFRFLARPEVSLLELVAA